MLPRFHWADITTVAHYLGTLVMVTGAAMLVPALVGLAFGEMRSVAAFVFGAGVCVALGSLLRIFRAYRLDRRRALLLSGTGWVLIAFVAGLPFALSGEFTHHIDAFFDAVSALTTTGATLAGDIDHGGRASAVWRALLTLAGGQAAVATAVYFGYFGEGVRDLFRSVRKEGDDKGRSRADSLAHSIVVVVSCYLALGLVVVSGLLIAQGTPVADSVLDAFVLVSNAVSTGGFVPHASSLAYYHSLPLEATLAVFMILGALNFGVYAHMTRGSVGRVASNTELRAFAVWLVAVVAIVAALLTRGEIVTSLAGLWSNGVFTAVSAATTSGMQIVPPEQYGLVLGENILVMISLAMLFGACSHSTGGGIKIARIMVVLRRIGYAIMSCLLPQSAHVRVKYEHFGTRTLTPSDSMSAMTILILYIIAAALGSMLFIAHGNDSVQSVLEAVSYVSNCGMSAGVTSPDMGFDLKVAAMLLMWMGRLEFIAVFAAVVGLLISIKPDNLTQGMRERSLRAKKSKTRGGIAWRRRKEQPKCFALHAFIAVMLVGALAVPSILSAPMQAYSTSEDVAQAGSTADAENEDQAQTDESASLDAGESYRDVEIADLLKATQRLEGRGVCLMGEVVGHAIQAQDGNVWVNIKQGRACIGVLMSESQAAQLQTFGGYDSTGDTVVIQGVYHLACGDNGGTLDVHADTVVVESVGGEIAHEWSEELLYTGFGLVGFGLVVTFAAFLLRRRTSRTNKMHAWV